jgi:hypothetical protein
MKVVSAEVSVIVHATEDQAKVSYALRNTLPDSINNDVKLTTQHAEGHYGNPIKILKTNLTKRKMIDQFFNNIFAKLNAEDLEDMMRNLETYVDEERNLYIRLDKQAAYMGELRSKQEDPIRIRMKLVDEFGRGKLLIDAVRELIDSYEKVR